MCLLSVHEVFEIIYEEKIKFVLKALEFFSLYKLFCQINRDGKGNIGMAHSLSGYSYEKKVKIHTCLFSV